MTLTLNQLQDVCLLDHPDKSRVCRYLISDELDENKWYCQKLRPNIKLTIDHDVFLSKKINANIAQGDNCPGYPFLRNIQQGYDLD